ncbi:MAG: 23S rRNA (adenine(2503)-C(2))-methyltransferase RlmN [Pseudomonadota bacterium]|nr:23S rRNA (adenine(2503)-C(2))-methyltransferase RlmN [Pseudomonadota bacterium]
MQHEKIKKNLIGVSRKELEAELIEMGEKTFRTKQLWHWIYHKGETDFSKMTSLGKSLRAKLEDCYIIAKPEIVTQQISEDTTHKWLLKTQDGNQVETVFIPEDDRGALCVSSQVGCTLTCSFCHTGTQKLVRNLTAGEIVGQMMIARDSYDEWPSDGHNRKLTNIVMMGMGEPLYNFDEVSKALRIIMDEEGISISRRRITLSTSGVVPLIERCGEELGVGLAVSLHAVHDELRNILVPINKKYPIKELIDACRRYPGSSNARRITFEYVMLDGINDSASDAKELARLLSGIPAKINLIPFNKWPGVEYECSSHHKIKKFSEILNERGLSAPIRMPRGRDIMAACGQLKSASKSTRKYSEKYIHGEPQQPLV